MAKDRTYLGCSKNGSAMRAEESEEVEPWL